MRRGCYAALAAVLYSSHVSALSLDPNNVAALQSATVQALKNLMSYYQPSAAGVFDQVQTPWHASSMIWATFMDYQKWTGDDQFASQVTGALVNLSYGTWQDVLGGPLTTTVEKVEGRWNDDILWPAIAFAGGAEIYGVNSAVPGANGPWQTVPQRTLEEAWQYEDDKCGGGIYWSRNPQLNAIWKSTITEVEFIQAAVRLNNLAGNSTILQQSKQLWDWLYAAKLFLPDGTVYDGVNTPACGSPIASFFTYNYGLAIGDASWLHYVTKNQTYLDQATAIFERSMDIFFTNGTNQMLIELCETLPTNCGRDAQDFKSVYLRNLAYLWRETQSQDTKNSIFRILDSSLQQMVTNACDANWNCNGNFTSAPIKYVRSQHVAAALLVASLGVHSNQTGNGLIPKIDNAPPPAPLNQTGDSTAGQNPTGNMTGWIESSPLMDAGVTIRQSIAGLMAALVLGLVMLV